MSTFLDIGTGFAFGSISADYSLPFSALTALRATAETGCSRLQTRLRGIPALCREETADTRNRVKLTRFPKKSDFLTKIRCCADFSQPNHRLGINRANYIFVKPLKTKHLAFWHFGCTNGRHATDDDNRRQPRKPLDYADDVFGR